MSKPFTPPPKDDPQVMDAMRTANRLGQAFITDEDFLKIHLDDKDWAAKEAAKPKGVNGNIFVIHGRERDPAPGAEPKRVLVPCFFFDWPPPEEMDGKPFGKRGAMVGLATKFVAEFPDQIPVVVSHIAEGWLSKSKEVADGKYMPSEDPQRIETVIVHTSTMDQRQSQSFREIKRRKSGHFDGLGEEFGREYVPGVIVDPRTQVDNSIIYFWMGYFAARDMSFGGVS